MGPEPCVRRGAGKASGQTSLSCHHRCPGLKAVTPRPSGPASRWGRGAAVLLLIQSAQDSNDQEGNTSGDHSKLDRTLAPAAAGRRAPTCHPPPPGLQGKLPARSPTWGVPEGPLSGHPPRPVHPDRLRARSRPPGWSKEAAQHRMERAGGSRAISRGMQGMWPRQDPEQTRERPLSPECSAKASAKQTRPPRAAGSQSRGTPESRSLWA